MNRSLLFKFLGLPMIQKDLFLAMKKTSWMVIQIIYLVVVGFVLSLNILNWKGTNSSPDSLWSTVSTTELVFVYLFMQMMALCVIFPFLAGSTISRERSEKTWALLRTTSMTPGELIRGKFFALLSQGVFILLISAPLLVMMTLLGGVALENLLMEYLIHVVLIAWISSVGVLSSAITRKGAASYISTPLFFFFPMLAALNGAGFTYLREKQTITSQLVTFHASDPEAFFLTISVVFITGLGSLLGAIHLTSPKNSVRSLPTRIGIFVLYGYAAIWFFVYAPTLLNVNRDREFLMLAFLSGILLVPLLRIAGAGPEVPLGIRQLGRDKPIASRLLVLFTPGGIRNLLFCVLIILLFIPAGLVGGEGVLSDPNVDVVTATAGLDFLRDLYFSVLFWIASLMALAWFLGQCGCGSILSASLAFTAHLIAVLVLTVLTVRSGIPGWPAYEPGLGMISTPYNLIQIAGTNSAINFQRGFPSYFDPGAVRMDTIFNIVTFLLFSVLGIVVSVVKKRPLFSVYSGDDGKLLLDLPDSASVSNDQQNVTDSISVVDPDFNSDSQNVKTKDES